MATQANPVVEEPKPTEQEITDTYIEKRLAGETTDLPVPPPTVEETIKPPEPEPVVETPQMKDVMAVDRFLEERKANRRGGKQARIDQLTREKAELESAKKELEEKAKTSPEAPKEEPKPPEVVVPPVVEAAKPTEVPKERPKLEDFTDANDYHAAMALWAVEQSKPVPKIEQAPPSAAPTPQVLQVRQEEFDKFLERGKQFIAGHPDFNTKLEAAHVRGLTLSEQARVAITRLAAPEVAYWLASPENDLAARQLMRLDEGMQVVEIGRIAERLAVSPADFVSNAPAPGTRINGNARNELPLSQIQDTDEYIRRRKEERRTRRGR